MRGSRQSHKGLSKVALSFLSLQSLDPFPLKLRDLNGQIRGKVHGQNDLPRKLVVGDRKEPFLPAGMCCQYPKWDGDLGTYPCLLWSRFMELAEVIIIIGGCDKKGLLKLPFTDLYHPKSRQWTALSSVPGYTKSEFAACTLKNDVYISGEVSWDSCSPHLELSSENCSWGRFTGTH